MHIAVRFPDDLAQKMKAVLDDANAFLRAQSIPETITVSGVVKAWIGERLEEEFEMLLRRKGAAGTPGRSNVLPFPARAKNSKRKD